MKILIINTYDIQGGAARAANRLHQALLGSGIDSKMLVQKKYSDDTTILQIFKNSKYQNIFHAFRSHLDQFPLKYYKNKTKTLFSPGWVPFSGISDKIESIDPDIVHLHWICGGMVPIEELKKIKRPIVWSLHDMWAFTGGCHYDENCGKYISCCGSCPVLGSKKENDLSKYNFTRKMKTYSKIDNLTVIGLSSWISDCARKSMLLSQYPVINLPNPIDTKQFFPVEKQKARLTLNLPLNKKLILYGAMSATSDPRKGYSLLEKALQIIPQGDDIELLVFGGSKPKNANDFGFKSHYLDYISEDILHLLYCAADVMVVPSLQENLSNSIMESLSCGTPVVAFNIGGNGDMIKHKNNGYLAEPFSPESLAEGIKWILNTSQYPVISRNAREKVLRCFDSKLVVNRYINLYNSLMS